MRVDLEAMVGKVKNEFQQNSQAVELPQIRSRNQELERQLRLMDTKY